MSEVNLEIEEKPKSVLEKPKRVRTQKQIDATAKLVASNKLKREAKKNATPTDVAVVPPVPVVEVPPPVVVETPPVVEVPPPVVVEVPPPVVVEVKKPKRKYTKKVKEVPPPKPATPPPVHYTNYVQNEESDYTSSDDGSLPEPKGVSLQSDPVPIQYFKLPRRYRVH
jgi:hypothetical protein